MPNDANPTKAAESGLWWLWLTALAVILDQTTKILILNTVELSERIPVLSVFNITHMHNYGAAFSFLSDAGGWQRWALTAVALVVSLLLLYWMKNTPKNNKLLGMSYSLILGGAIGNLYDRIAYGYVEDFLHFYYQNYHFPAFNIADSAITLGAFLLIIEAFTTPKQEEVSSDSQ